MGSLFSKSCEKENSSISAEKDASSCAFHSPDASLNMMNHTKDESEGENSDITNGSRASSDESLDNTVSSKKRMFTCDCRRHVKNTCQCSSGIGAKLISLDVQKENHPAIPSQSVEHFPPISNDSDLEEHENFGVIEDKLMTKCPPQVRTKILSYCTVSELVHSVSLVNKAWHESAYDHELWKYVDLQKHVMNDQVIQKVVTLCPYIKCIKFPESKDNKLTNNGVIHLADSCPNLRSFQAPRSGPKLDEGAVIALAEHCPELKHLSLDFLDITDKALSSIARNLGNLTYLCLCQVSYITDDGVKEVLRRCHKLETLILNQNNQITEACLEPISNSSCILKRLELLMCNIHVSGIPAIGHLYNLHHLNLSKCAELNEHHLLPVFRGCPKLRLLSLNLNALIDDSCVVHIMNSFPELNQIYLVSTSITDDALITMGNKGKKLRKVDVGYTKVTLEGARKISELCPELEYLGLMRCDLITEESVEKLVESFPRIMYSTFMQDAKRLLEKANIPFPKLGDG